MKQRVSIGLDKWLKRSIIHKDHVHHLQHCVKNGCSQCLFIGKLMKWKNHVVMDGAASSQSARLSSSKAHTEALWFGMSKSENGVITVGCHACSRFRNHACCAQDAWSEFCINVEKLGLSSLLKHKSSKKHRLAMAFSNGGPVGPSGQTSGGCTREVFVLEGLGECWQ